MDRRDSTASQETFISLQQLDPSPIDTPPEELINLEKQRFDTPPPQALGRPHTLGLSGGGGHSHVYYRIFSRIFLPSLKFFSSERVLMQK